MWGRIKAAARRVKHWVITAIAALAAAIGLVGQQATAADLTAQWTPPTQRVDGSALDPANDLGGYLVICDDQQIANPPPDATSATIQLSVGDHSCYMVAYLPGAKDDQSRWSGPSNVVSVTVQPALPKPIVDFSLSNP